MSKVIVWDLDAKTQKCSKCHRMVPNKKITTRLKKPNKELVLRCGFCFQDMVTFGLLGYLK